MNRYPQENQYPGFLFGLVAGAALGAGLAMYFAPKIRAEIQQRVADSAKDLGDTASGYYEQVSTRLGAAVDDLTIKGQQARHAAADVVVRGAHEVARGAHAVERLSDAAAKAARKQ
jgi:gas vesicle protein